MSRDYYPLRYRLDHTVAFLLWYSSSAEGEADGVALDVQGRVLSFRDLRTLQAWASSQGYAVEIDEEPVLHDLDTTDWWSQNPACDTVNCDAILTAWNLFLDIRSSIEQRNVLREDSENNDIYNKIFWGNNLPSMIPPGKHYTPLWSEKEVARLSRILREGLRLFRERAALFQ